MNRTSSVFSAIVAIAAVLALAAVPAHATFPGQVNAGLIAFQSNRDVGSTCSINTTVNTLFGSTAITESKRAIWQLTDLVRLYDGGADGVASTTADNTLFQMGGVFIP